MPVGDIVGEFVAEIILRPIVSVVTHVFGALGYFSGAAFLTILSFGRLGLAPLDSLFDAGRFDRRREFTLGIWMDQPGKRRVLKAGWVCVAGVVLWIVAGVCIYQATKSREALEKPAVPAAVQ